MSGVGRLKETSRTTGVEPPLTAGYLYDVMNTARKIYEADDEGVVHVQLPTGKPGRRVEVLVVWEDSEQETTSANEDISDLVGLLRDVPLERPPQGEYEKRDELG